MIELIVILALAIGGSTTLAAKDGAFKKGFDTTKVDTLKFEKRAAEMDIEYQKAQLEKINGQLAEGGR